MLKKLLTLSLLAATTVSYGMRYNDDTWVRPDTEESYFGLYPASWASYMEKARHQSDRRFDEQAAYIRQMAAAARADACRDDSQPMGAGAGAGAGASYVCNGINIKDLPRDGRHEMRALDKDIKRAVENCDTKELERMRAEINDKLAMTNISQETRDLCERKLELLDSHTQSPEVVAFRDMRDGEDVAEAEASFKYLADKYKRGEMSQEKFIAIEKAFAERPEKKAQTARLLATCDWANSDLNYGREMMDINQRLRESKIDLDKLGLDFDLEKGSLNPATTQHYIQANMAAIGMAVESDPILDWPDFGVATMETVQEVFKPVVAAAGMGYGAGGKLVRPMIDTGHMICNVMGEFVQKHYGVNAETPINDAFDKWKADSAKLYEEDPFKAGENLGAAIVDVLLPFIKKAPMVEADRMAAYKRTLATSKNATKEWEPCTIV